MGRENVAKLAGDWVFISSIFFVGSKQEQGLTQSLHSSYLPEFVINICRSQGDFENKESPSPKRKGKDSKMRRHWILFIYVVINSDSHVCWQTSKLEKEEKHPNLPPFLALIWQHKPIWKRFVQVLPYVESI